MTTKDNPVLEQLRACAKTLYKAGMTQADIEGEIMLACEDAAKEMGKEPDR